MLPRSERTLSTPARRGKQNPKKTWTAYINGNISREAGGAACILVNEDGTTSQASRGYHATTGPRADLLALILCLEALEGTPAVLEIISDCRYLTQGLAKLTATGSTPKTNPDLWRSIAELSACHQVTATWVSSRDRCHLGAIADALATAAARNPTHYDHAHQELQAAKGGIGAAIDGMASASRCLNAQDPESLMHRQFQDQDRTKN